MAQIARRQFFTSLLAPATAGLGLAAAAAWAQSPPAAPIPAAALIQPAQFAQQLRGGSAQPLILQVGFQKLFEEAHIPGSVYAGPGRDAAGLTLLRKQAATVATNHPIVIYCGCCPWVRCPNIRAAYAALKAQGYTRLKALYIADNFGADWVNKGYPVTPAA